MTAIAAHAHGAAGNETAAPDLIAVAYTLGQRRKDLIRLFGDDAYLEHTRHAKAQIGEAMDAHRDLNPISAALTVCRALRVAHPGQDVSTAEQFLLAAAADLVEGR